MNWKAWSYPLFLLLAGCTPDRGNDHTSLYIKSGEVSITAYDSGEVLLCFWPYGKIVVFVLS